MQTYEIVVKNRSVFANSDDMTLVRTSAGIDQLHVLFDNEEWLGFPVTVSFGHAENVVTQAMSLASVSSDAWAAEATVTIPREVTEEVGRVRVTFQGTDSEGRRIVTAAGAPLFVEEAGDVIIGSAPADAPTTDQWNQAYADAVEAASRATSVADGLSEQIDIIVSDARAQIQSLVESLHVPATADTLGLIKVGNNLTINSDGVLSAFQEADEEDIDENATTFTFDQANALMNLRVLAAYAFDSEFGEDGVLKDTVKVKESALPKTPVASVGSLGVVKPDGTTVIVDEDGMLHASYFSHEWNGTVLTTHTLEGSTSVDLIGPSVDFVGASGTVSQTVGEPSVEVSVSGTRAKKTLSFAFSGIKGEKGDRGERGPSGYELTEEDVETISNAIYERYVSGDETRY